MQPDKLLNRNFVLLFQGQFVSQLGSFYLFRRDRLLDQTCNGLGDDCWFTCVDAYADFRRIISLVDGVCWR